MANLCSYAGHGGAGVVDGPGLDGGILGHADQQAGAHKAGPHLPAITLGKDIDKIVAGIEPLLPQRSEVQRIDEDQAGVGPQG